MNEIMIFTSTEFGEIRTLKENNKVLFCGSDITKALGYGNASAALNRHCKAMITETNGKWLSERSSAVCTLTR